MYFSKSKGNEICQHAKDRRQRQMGVRDRLYQPALSLKRDRAFSAEALLRWNHPTLGPVSYTNTRAHETLLDLVCRPPLEKKKQSSTFL